MPTISDPMLAAPAPPAPPVPIDAAAAIEPAGALRRPTLRVLPEPAARVLYVLKRYPRLSETFIVREILGLEGAGVHVGVDALLEPDQLLRHPELDQVHATVRYLSGGARRGAAGAAAHLRVAVRRPGRWTRLAVRAVRARRRGERKALRRFSQAVAVADRARRERFDHLHAHFATAAAEVARDAAALSGRRFTVTAHAKDIFHADNAGQLRRRLGDAAAVVTVSQYNLEHLRGQLPGAEVRYVPNGLPRPVAHGPDPAGPIVCVARLVAKKGVDVLLRAIAQSHTDRMVEIIGDGPCRAELEALAATLGISSRVRFHGALRSDAVAEHYRRCSMLVLACRVAADGDRDGMPTVLVEAMARALPVVSTEVAGIGELVRDGRTGRLVAPEDPAALAAAIDDLVGDAALGERLGRQAAEAVRRAFDPAEASIALRAVFDAAARR